ncbi:MAG: DinB family protein [Bryobacterales bacterium]|nr:DinB family protein [Bryobacterales bacterium]
MNPLNSPPDPSPDTPWELPIGDILDLHSIPPRDAKPVLEAWLEQVHLRQFPAVRIIHGRGIGVQREMVRNVLSRTPFVISFSDAPAEAGGWGATIASLAASIEQQPMPTESDRLRTELETVRHDAEALAAPLSDVQWNWRPAPSAWSIGQCFDHLAITDRLYAEKIQAAIQSGRAQNLTSPGPFRYSWLDRLFIWAIAPPVYMRFSAPEMFRPAPQPRDVPRSALQQYLTGNLTLQQLAGKADGLDLAGIRIASPASANIRLSLGAAFLTMAAHGRRHLAQARKLTTLEDFPKA